MLFCVDFICVDKQLLNHEKVCGMYVHALFDIGSYLYLCKSKYSIDTNSFIGKKIEFYQWVVVLVLIFESNFDKDEINLYWCSIGVACILSLFTTIQVKRWTLDTEQN